MLLLSRHRHSRWCLVPAYRPHLKVDWMDLLKKKTEKTFSFWPCDNKCIIINHKQWLPTDRTKNDGSYCEYFFILLDSKSSYESLNSNILNKIIEIFLLMSFGSHWLSVRSLVGILFHSFVPILENDFRSVSSFELSGETIL